MKAVGVTFTAPETSHAINLLPGAKTTLVTWTPEILFNLNSPPQFNRPTFWMTCWASGSFEPHRIVAVFDDT